MAFNKGLTIVDANPAARNSISLDNLSHGLFQSHKTSTDNDSANGSLVFTLRPGAKSAAGDDNYQELIKGQNLVVGLEYNTTPAATAGTEFRLVIQNRVDYNNVAGTTDAVYSDYVAVNTETTFGLTFQQNGTLTLMQSGGIIKTLDITSWSPPAKSVSIEEVGTVTGGLIGHIILDDLKGNQVEIKTDKLAAGTVADGMLSALLTEFNKIDDRAAPKTGVAADGQHGFKLGAVTGNAIAISRTDGADFKIIQGLDATQGSLMTQTALPKPTPTAFLKFAAGMNGKKVFLDFTVEGGSAVAGDITLAAASTTAALAAAEYAATAQAMTGYTGIVDPTDDTVVQVTGPSAGSFTVAVDSGNSDYATTTLKISDSGPSSYLTEGTVFDSGAVNTYAISNITKIGLNTSDSDILDRDFDGFISQVAEFETVLTSTELQSYVNSPATIPTPEINTNANAAQAIIDLSGDVAQNNAVYEIILNKGLTGTAKGELKFKFTEASAADNKETLVFTGLKTAFDTEAATTAGNRGFAIDASVTGQLKITRADGADFTVSRGEASTYVATSHEGHLEVNEDAVGKNVSQELVFEFNTIENIKRYNINLIEGVQAFNLEYTESNVATDTAAIVIDALIADAANNVNYTATRSGTKYLNIERTDGQAFTQDFTSGIASNFTAGANVKHSINSGATFVNAAINIAIASQAKSYTTVHTSESPGTDTTKFAAKAAKGVLTLSAGDLATSTGKAHEIVLDSGAGQIATINAFIPLSTTTTSGAMTTFNTVLASAAIDAGTDGDIDIDANGDGDNTDAGDETGFNYNLQSQAYLRFPNGITNGKVYNFSLQTGAAAGGGDDELIEHTGANAEGLSGDRAVTGLIQTSIAPNGFTLSKHGDGKTLKIVREDGAAFTVSAADNGGAASDYAIAANVTSSEDGITFANLPVASLDTTTAQKSGAQIEFERRDGKDFTIKLGANDEAGKLKFYTEEGTNALTALTKNATVSTTNGVDKSVAATVSNKVIQNFDFTTLNDASVVTSGGVTNYAAKASTDILGLSKRDGTTLVKLATTTVGMPDVDATGYSGAAAASSGGSAANVLYGQLRDVAQEGANREMLIDIFVDKAKITDGNFQSLSYTVDFSGQSLDLLEYSQLKPTGGYELTDTTSATDKVTAAWFQPTAVTDFSKAVATMKLKNLSPGTTNPLLTFTKVDIDGVDFNDNSTYATSFTDSLSAKLVDIGDDLTNGINNTKKMAGELVAVEASTGSALAPNPSTGLYLTLNNWSAAASAANPNVQYDLNLKTAVATQVIKFKIDLPATATSTTFVLDDALDGDAANNVAAIWTLQKNAIEGRSLVVEGTGSTALAANATLGKVTSTITNGHGKTSLFEVENVQTDTDTAFETGRDLYVATATTNTLGKWSVTDLPVGIMSRYYEGAAVKAQSSVTAMDALHALQISAGAVPSWYGLATSTDGMIKAADFDNSGKVTAADALALLQASVAPNADARMDWFFYDSLTTGVLVDNVAKNIKTLNANFATSVDNALIGQLDKVVLIGDLTDPGV